MEFLIKKATISDLKDIQRLNRELFKKEFTDFDDTLDLEWTFSEIGERYYTDHITRDDNCALVAVIDDEIVGYLVGCISITSSYRVTVISAELENMFVRDTHRGVGIGSNLYEAFAHWCKSK